MALSKKRRAFIDEYLKDFNATQAAIRAGYSARSAGSIGHENLKIPEIAEEVSRRIAERTMTTDEALIRLSDQAHGSIEPFLQFQERRRPDSSEEEPDAEQEEPVYTGEFWVDLGKARDAGVLHLVKEVRQDKKVFTYDDGTTETTYRTMVKLHDAQAALKLILEHHARAGAGPQEHVFMSLDEWKAEAERRRQEAASVMALFEDDE